MALHRPAEFNKSHLPAFLGGEEARPYILRLTRSSARTSGTCCRTRSGRFMLAEHGKMARGFRRPGQHGRLVRARATTSGCWPSRRRLHRIVDLMRELRASTARRHVREEVPFYTAAAARSPMVAALPDHRDVRMPSSPYSGAVGLVAVAAVEATSVLGVQYARAVADLCQRVPQEPAGPVGAAARGAVTTRPIRRTSPLSGCEVAGHAVVVGEPQMPGSGFVSRPSSSGSASCSTTKTSPRSLSTAYREWTSSSAKAAQCGSGSIPGFLGGRAAHRCGAGSLG